MGDVATQTRLTADRICAAIVTYSNRADLCLRVLDGVDRSGITSVVIVDNGSTPEARTKLLEAAERDDVRVIIETLDRNTGSAGGFGAAIDLALTRTNADFIWLLDDDNVPADDALAALCRAYDSVESVRRPTTALMAYRPDRLYQREVANGVPVGAAYPRRSSFLSFHAIAYARRVLSRERRTARSSPTARRTAPIPIPYGPYGGLLSPRELLETVGLPNAGFVMYEDDAEFTHRLEAHRADLLLIPSSVLNDVDTSWYAAATGNPFSRLLGGEADSPVRVFYSIRNRVFFERTVWTGNRLIYVINRFIVIAGLLIVAATSRRWARYRLIRRAMRDGAAGRLGTMPPDLGGT